MRFEQRYYPIFSAGGGLTQGQVDARISVVGTPLFAAKTSPQVWSPSFGAVTAIDSVDGGYFDAGKVRTGGFEAAAAVDNEFLFTGAATLDLPAGTSVDATRVFEGSPVGRYCITDLSGQRFGAVEWRAGQLEFVNEQGGRLGEVGMEYGITALRGQFAIPIN